MGDSTNGLKLGTLSVIGASNSVGKSLYTANVLLDMYTNVPNKTFSITQFEEIGGVVFPVTYFNDGLVIVDYPTIGPKNKSKE